MVPTLCVLPPLLRPWDSEWRLRESLMLSELFSKDCRPLQVPLSESLTCCGT
jgi:hypothetical protein